MATMRTARQSVSRRLDLALAVGVFGDELDRHPEQQRAADELEVRVGHRLRDDEREQHAQQHRDAGAEDHAPQPLPRRQRHAGHRDDDGVVAGQDDVDADDLQHRDPERRVQHVLQQEIHGQPLVSSRSALRRAAPPLRGAAAAITS